MKKKYESVVPSIYLYFLINGRTRDIKTRIFNIFILSNYKKISGIIKRLKQKKSIEFLMKNGYFQKKIGNDVCIILGYGYIKQFNIDEKKRKRIAFMYTTHDFFFNGRHYNNPVIYHEFFECLEKEKKGKFRYYEHSSGKRERRYFATLKTFSNPDNVTMYDLIKYPDFVVNPIYITRKYPFFRSGVYKKRIGGKFIAKIYKKHGIELPVKTINWKVGLKQKLAE